MSNQFSYYTAENMQDKKLSDLRTDRNFLRDGVTFLKSGRKGYTDEEISEMSADDVVSEVLEHFRYQTVNEVTMAKDMYYLKDDTVDADEKQSFGRLMFAFDNAKGEGLFDRGGEKIGDYFGGVGSAPTTYASVLAGLGSAGTGAAAIPSARRRRAGRARRRRRGPARAVHRGRRVPARHRAREPPSDRPVPPRHPRAPPFRRLQGARRAQVIGSDINCFLRVL